MWQCVTVSATSEGGQQFWGVFVWAAVGTDSVFGLTPGEIIWYQYHARGHQYEIHLNSPRLKALRKR